MPDLKNHPQPLWQTDPTVTPPLHLRIWWAFGTFRYLLSATVQQGRLSLQPYSGWEWTPMRRRRLTVRERAGWQACAATRCFLQAALHIVLGCVRAKKAGCLYFQFLRESLSTALTGNRQQVSESQRRRENATFVLPCHPSNTQELGPSGPSIANTDYKNGSKL
jgi:hypothetical protein